MRFLSCLILTLAIVVSIAWADERHHHALTKEQLGSVHFSPSCTKRVQADFNRAVALLHSFQYEQADQAFTQISVIDPTCAMSQWGVGMANYHGLWDNGDFDRGRAALQKANQVAAANKSTTLRERAYIAALDEIYKHDGKDNYSHAQAFEQKMATLQAAYPDDTEAAIFHALT